jgi:Domain of unknown function (DUF4440)
VVPFSTRQFWNTHSLSAGVLIAFFLTMGCSQHVDDKDSAKGLDASRAQGTEPKISIGVTAAEVLDLDRRYWDGMRAGNWAAVASLIAPEYYGVGATFELNLEQLKLAFPKIKLLSYHLEPPRVKQVGPDLVVVSYVGSMRESFDGQDNSGRYWYSTTWTRRDNRWQLLVEEEVRVGPFR